METPETSAEKVMNNGIQKLRTVLQEEQNRKKNEPSMTTLAIPIPPPPPPPPLAADVEAPPG